jgi:hypothetical protein
LSTVGFPAKLSFIKARGIFEAISGENRVLEHGRNEGRRTHSNPLGFNRKPLGFE